MTSSADPGYHPGDLDDIPGTTIFTIGRSRQAYHLHRFCMSLMKSENRDMFRADEQAYSNRFDMSDEQREAVLARDYNRLIGLGGNIYFLVKIASTDGKSAAQAVSTMTDLSPDDYVAMMVAGGRSPEGNRSITGRY